MIETKSATVERTVHAVPPMGVEPMPAYDPRVSIRPERLELVVSRDEGDSRVRWFVSVRGVRVLASGELGTQQRSGGFSASDVERGEELPAWLAPWVREQVAIFEAIVEKTEA